MSETANAWSTWFEGLGARLRETRSNPSRVDVLARPVVGDARRPEPAVGFQRQDAGGWALGRLFWDDEP